MPITSSRSLKRNSRAKALVGASSARKIIKQGNSYYEDLHESLGKFDFVLANPPFNVDKVDKEKIKDDPRFPFGMPRSDNANYLWIQLFYSSLNAKG